jgi:glycosyltransferase involved in cell wall biosynthesis
LRLERAVWRSVDISYYPSEHEVNIVRKLDPSVNVKYLSPYYFDLKNDGPCFLPSGTSILFVGNFIHSPNSDAVEWLICEIWPLIRENSPASELIIVGSGMSDRLHQLCQTFDGVHVKGWVSDDELTQLYEQVRVVIAPLRFGAGVKHKVLAALAHSRPLVTTSIGIQGLDMLINEVVVAESAHEIATSCTRLLEDDELWMLYATAGRKAISNRFTRSAMWEAFSDLKAEKGVSAG